MLKQRMRRFVRRMGSNVLALIAGGFALIILLGSVLLALPCATQTGQGIGWFDGLFTSTSAVCVTGLVVRDTGTTFNLFGQLVLLCLIEVGGLGFMTFATLVFRILGRQISLKERMLIRESLNESGTGGMDSLIRWVAVSAFTVQGMGALVLCIRFIPLYGPLKGAYYSIFHAVSAFCNAGFDLFGNYSSLTGFRGDALINLTIMAIIIIGGLGFGVLRNLLDRKKGHYFFLQTRLVLVTYASLLVFGCLFVLIAEWGNPETLGGLPFGEKLLAALFQSVTLRTAGFNTINQQAMYPATKLVSSILMIIGASPASAGGGIKVTTFAVIILAVRMTVRRDNGIVIFRRSIPDDIVRRAQAVAAIAVAIAVTDIIVISLLQPELDFMDLVMECASAMGTVGVSAFGSASLNTVSRIMIIFTMYLGRIGPLTMALALGQKRGSKGLVQYPEGNIMIG